ncbi:MAG TPA: hypothetical protein VJV05_11290 [Pyrinomonadaceae bacterium]|nr:hypothetical protein [Pyrinomonadaceae bacterium]
MKILLLILALAIPSAAQIEQLMKQGANVTLKDEALVFVPVKFEPCTLIWQIKRNNVITRETTMNLGDLDPDRIRVEPVRDEPGIIQVMLYTISSRELITEQTVYKDDSRGELSNKSVQVILVKKRSTADKLAQAFASGARTCIEKTSRDH